MPGRGEGWGVVSVEAEPAAGPSEGFVVLEKTKEWWVVKGEAGPDSGLGHDL